MNNAEATCVRARTLRMIWIQRHLAPARISWSVATESQRLQDTRFTNHSRFSRNRQSLYWFVVQRRHSHKRIRGVVTGSVKNREAGERFRPNL